MLQVLLDRAVLPLGRMELLPDCDAVTDAAGNSEADGGGEAGPEFVRMDASALENLEVPWLRSVCLGRLTLQCCSRSNPVSSYPSLWHATASSERR